MKSIQFKIAGLLCMATVCSCTPDPPEPNNNTNISIADKVAGRFNGTGSYLAGGISLGSTSACAAPAKDYRTLFEIGNASVNITRLTDSTVAINLLTGPFPKDSYSPVKLIENGSVIAFSLGNLFSIGFFDTNTKVISFSARAPNYSYSYLRSCQAGLPYYASNVSVPVPDKIDHYTIKRYEFGGTKQ